MRIDALVVLLFLFIACKSRRDDPQSEPIKEAKAPELNEEDMQRLDHWIGNSSIYIHVKETGEATTLSLTSKSADQEGGGEGANMTPVIAALSTVFGVGAVVTMVAVFSRRPATVKVGEVAPIPRPERPSIPRSPSSPLPHRPAPPPPAPPLPQRNVHIVTRETPTPPGSVYMSSEPINVPRQPAPVQMGGVYMGRRLPEWPKDPYIVSRNETTETFSMGAGTSSKAITVYKYDVKGDGNCGYYAIYAQLNLRGVLPKSQGSNFFSKAEAEQWILSQKKEFTEELKLVKGVVGLDSATVRFAMQDTLETKGLRGLDSASDDYVRELYIQDINQPNSWIDELVLRWMAERHGVSLEVKVPKKPELRDENGRIIQMAEPEGKTEMEGPPSTRANPIRLNRINHNHYQILLENPLVY